MSTAVKLIAELGAAGIQLWLDENEQLRFRAPKGAMTAAFKTAISQTKADIIAFLAQSQTTHTVIKAPREAHKAYELSAAQQRFIFLDTLLQGDASQNIPAVLQLDGVLDRQRLEKALACVVARHEILRTIFITQAEQQIAQVVLEHLAYPIDFIDLSDEKDKQAQLENAIKTQALHHFTLISSRENPRTLMQIRLLKLAEQQHFLLLNVHHSISDGWSIRLLIQELSTFYQQPDVSLAAVDYHYIDFVYHQQQQNFTQQLQFWQRTLADVPNLHLPLDYPRPVQNKNQGDSVNLAIDSTLYQAITTLAAAQHSSSFNVLLSAFAILLYRYSGAEDFCIGTPVSGREEKAFEQSLGCFINVLALRQSLQSAQSFSDFLQQNQKTILSAQENQAISFEQVAKHCASRSMAISPLFQVMFSTQENIASQFNVADLAISLQAQRSFTAKYDLQLHVEPSQITIEYNSALFSAATMQRMAAHYLQLLHAIIAHPQAAIAQLDIFSANERDFLLPTTTIAPTTQSLLALLDHSSCQIIDSKQRLNFSTLKENAKNLAAYLQQQGFAVGCNIGILLPFSVEHSTAVLACIQAGFCYVPIDSRYGRERISHMVNQAELQTILTFSTLENLLDNSAPRLLLDQITLETQPFHAPTFTEQERLYLIYTSGSTGAPKGAGVTRANEINLLQWYAQHYQFTSADNFLVFSALGFDLTQKNLLVPLLCGAKLHYPASTIYDPHALLAQIAQQQISVINCAPSAFYPIVELAIHSQQLEKLRSVRWLLLGGEPIEFANFTAWLAHPSCQVKISNMYGPTECTDITSSWLCEENTTAPIGEAIDGVFMYLLDDDKNAVPIGAAGELYIGGSSVGSGYFNQEALNKESFIANPFGEGKLYKTGDKVKLLPAYLPKKVYQFIARADEQVKIRGLRIEPEEIAQQLITQAHLHDAKVFADTTQEALVAYYISDAIHTPADLRDAIKNHLPDYMLPSAYVPLHAWPLSANGKLDKKQLAVPSAEHRITHHYIAANTATEQALCALWQAQLTLEQVGVEDNFFELGGHSLSAARLIAQVNTQFQSQVMMADFFQTPTIRALATLIEQGANLEHFNDILSVQADRTTTIPLSYSQQRLWIIEQINPQSALYNIPLCLKIEGALDRERFIHALETLFARHESLRTRIAVDAQGNPYQAIFPADSCAITLSQLSPSSDTTAYATAFAQQNFDLAKDCLTRIELAQITENSHVLLICMHHIISDGWSISILQKELAALYQAPESLAALPLQYADFSVWQQQALQQDNTQQAVNYWLQQLADIPACIHLPFDRPRPAQQSFNGDIFRTSLSKELSEQLQQFSQQQEVSLYSTLLGFYSLLLHKYSQQETICIGTPVSGREISELQNIIGYFVNAVVMRCDIAPQISVNEHIQHCAQTALAAFAHQHIPIEKVLEQLPLERNASYPPVAQVGFSLINGDLAAMPTLPHLQFELIDYQQTVAKYELTLIIIQREDRLELNFEYNTDLFNRTTIATLAERFTTLMQAAMAEPEKNLRQLSVFQSAEIAQFSAIDNANIEAIYPLSQMQYDMVFSQYVQPESLANTLGYRAELPTFIDADLWQAACQLTCQQEPITRTVFAINQQAYGEFAWQCVLKTLATPLTLMDYRAEQLNEATITERVSQFIYQPSAYQQGTFIRYGLMRISDTRTILLLSAHHALLDGVSIVLIAQQTAQFYELLAQQQKPEIMPRPFTQAHYVIAEQETRDSLAVRQFWQQKLNHCQALNFVSPYLAAPKQIIKTHTLSAALSKRLRDYCKAKRMTSAQLIKLLYGLMIMHYCRADEDFYFSEFSTGRSRYNATALGCYFEQTPFIFPAKSLQQDSQLDDLFAYLRDYRKQIKAFDALSLGQTRQLSTQGKLHFMYNYYHFFPQQQTLQGQPITCIETPPFIEQTVQFIAKEHADTFTFDLYYPQATFADRNFLERLSALIEQITQGTETLSELNLLLPDETLLQGKAVPIEAGFNNIAQSLTQAAQQHAQSTALIDAQGELSYQQLMQQVNALAHYLREQGTQAGDCIAVALPRNRQAIISILAIVQAGACYLPLAHNTPLTRINSILTQAQCRFVFSHSEQENTYAVPVLSFAALDLTDYSKAAPVITIDQQQALYTIFTSGSTGQPKGAAVSHANAINLYQWYSKEYQINAQSRTLLISALGFDLSQKNIFTPLLNGATLVLDEQENFDIQVIQQLIATQKISHLNCAPSMFYALSETQWPLLKSLQHVILGGEHIEANRLKAWHENADNQAQLSNHYGPTECSDIALYYAVEDIHHAIVLGKPNDNVSVCLVNRFKQILPQGLTGEIAISGAGVGLGYLNNPQANEEKFIALLGAKTYLSGDLGVQDQQGNMHFAGRVDFQIKIRGQRIELGEIEAALKAQDNINDALIIVQDEQLIAYLLTTQPVDAANLKIALSNVLPSYMLPQHYIALQKWPLNSNGKIDRKALPKVDLTLAKTPFIAPRDDIEQAICAIVQRILNIEKVGVLDNFFDLGGHSLAASRAIVQIREQFQIDIPLSVLFELSSAEKLANYIKAAQWAIESAKPQEEEAGRDSGFI